ncbi:MAG TPA: UbiD family decarboxylase, partial [Planctomycetota bacterium]|nr:UbiD family decarboxylase [Planctomycetota bacterium]
QDLRAFLQTLRSEREVVEISAPVDSELEAAEVHRRVIAAGGPALYFSQVQGAAFPLVTGLFGTQRRVELAFGPRPEALIREVARLPEELMPPSLGKLWKHRSLFQSLAKVGMRTSRRGPVTEVVEADAALHRLPALKTWKRDGGPFLTLPLVMTQHPQTGVPNLGMYRVQVFDDREVGVHMQIGKGGGFHLAAAEAQGQALPVRIHLGGPPALILSAIAPLPENVPELLLTSLCLGRKLPLVRDPGGGPPVVASAEFVLCGSIEPGARRPEGPFGDHYGYYSEIHDYPFMKVHSLMRRKDAIFPATVVGKPRQEDFFIGDYLQELLSPLFPLVMPTVLDLWSYGETGYHALSAARVRERYRREAMMSAFRILGEGQLSLTKFLLLTDGAVDLHDFPATLTYILERADFRSDLFLLPHLAMDSLDYAGPKIDQGSKGILLGVGDPIRKLRDRFEGTPSPAIGRVRVFCPGCLVVDLAQTPSRDWHPRDLAQDPAFADWPLVVLSDDAERATRSSPNFLWTTFTRFDPARDLHAKESRLLNQHAAHTPPLVLDARMKPGYPEELFCDEATAALVDRRWKEYFPQGGVEMGDSDRGHLD